MYASKKTKGDEMMSAALLEVLGRTKHVPKGNKTRKRKLFCYFAQTLWLII